MNTLQFAGADDLRAVLTCSLLSGRPAVLDDVRPRFSDAEVAFVDLLAKIAPGTRATVSADGSRLDFVPGPIEGAQVSEKVPTERSLGWYLEYLLVILPFGKLVSRVTLEGATHANGDLSVDALETLIDHVRYFAKTDDF